MAPPFSYPVMSQAMIALVSNGEVRVIDVPHRDPDWVTISHYPVALSQARRKRPASLGSYGDE